MKEHSLTVRFKIGNLSLKNYQGQTCKINVAFHYKNGDGKWRSRSRNDISPTSQVRLFRLLDGKKPASEVYSFGKFNYEKPRTFEVSFEDMSL